MEKLVKVIEEKEKVPNFIKNIFKKLPFLFKLIDNFSKVKNQFLKVLKFSKDINNDDSDSEDPLD